MHFDLLYRDVIAGLAWDAIADAHLVLTDAQLYRTDM